MWCEGTGARHRQADAGRRGLAEKGGAEWLSIEQIKLKRTAFGKGGEKGEGSKKGPVDSSTGRCTSLKNRPAFEKPRRRIRSGGRG